MKTSDGSLGRPLAHGEDICEAVYCTVEAPVESVNGEIFTVGQNGKNYCIYEISKMVAQVFTGFEVKGGQSMADNRSYRVVFDKIATRLPSFRCR